MPRNAGGVYTLPPSNPVVTQTPISSSGWANPTLQDLAAAMTDSIAKTGVTTPTANLPMGGFKHIAVALATALDHYVRADQDQTNIFKVLTNVAMAVPDVYTATLVLAPTSFLHGQLLIIEFPSTNLGPVTLNINGTGARPILKANGDPLGAGACKAGDQFIIIYDGTDWRMFIDASGFTSAEVIGALGYIPVNPNGSVPMTGQLTLVTPPVATTDAASKAYVDAGVRSFNTRTGAVVLTSADVTGALTYTPVNKAGDTMAGNLSHDNFNSSNNRTVTFNSQIIATPTTGAVAVNFATGQKQKLTLTGIATLTFAFPGVGHYQLWLVSGAFAVTWPTPDATWQWLNSPTSPLLNTGTYGGLVNLYYDGTMTIASYSKVGAA